MDSWQSDDIDGDVIEIIPVEEYDKLKAKVRASVSWVLCKAYDDKVPVEFQDPFYTTGDGKWQIKPRLANVLASSEVYCQACRQLFGENASQWTGHWSIIQVLSRKGIYAVGTDSVDVTETILMQSAPFKIKAHLALIDALMLAFSQEIITIERVTQAVRRFASFNASSELPADTEAAILFWVNKVCVTVQRHLQKGENTIIEGGETSQKVRIVSSKTPRDSICVPIMEQLVEDMGDGCSLATVISFYCPQILKLEDVCLKSNVGIADSLYNLRLIRSFCDRHLPYRACHFTFEDLLYTDPSIRENIMIMLAEMFYWFEVKVLPIVTGGTAVGGGGGDGPTKLQCTSTSKLPGNMPISNVTKQSFQRVKGDVELRSSSSPDVHRLSPSSSTAPIPPRMPLLNRRQQHGQGVSHDDQSLYVRDVNGGIQRTHSLTSHDLRNKHGAPRQSTLAWQDNIGIPTNQSTTLPGTDRSGMSNNLLANVSIDSDMNASFSSGSIDLGDLDNSPRPDTERSKVGVDQSQTENTVHFSLLNKQKTPYPEHMDLESVNSGMDNFDSNTGELTKGCDSSKQFSPKGDNLEPLLPARLKPAKEKSNNHTKEEERGEIPKRKTPSPPKVKKKVMIDSQSFEIDNSVESLGNVTPVPSEEQLLATATQSESEFYPEAEKLPQRYDAFFVGGSVAESQNLLTARSDVTIAESYTIDQVRTPEAARAAGIPVIEETSHRRLSREGSVASSKSSGEFSDHESQKIHFDHKTRECSNKNSDKIEANVNLNNNFSDPRKYIMQKPVLVNRQPKDLNESEKIPNKGVSTNFAQIRQMKQFGQMDNSALVYMQHAKGDQDRPSLKDTYQRNKSEKKTSFAPLPNQTTWGQSSNTDSTNQEGASASNSSPAENGNMSQEFLKIKLKLEEKRKAIERKKHTQEIQQQKMRQRLGKAAFLHVVAKPKDDESVTKNSQAINSLNARMTTSDPELPVAASGLPEARMMNSSSSSSSSSPMRSPSLKHPQIPRPFSRDGIQQTIENVRKKWFDDKDLVAPRDFDRNDCDSPEMSRSVNDHHRNVPYNDEDDLESKDDGQISNRPVFDRRSTSVERITSLVSPPEQDIGVNPASPRGQFDRRSASMERSTIPQPHVQGSFDRRSASMERNDLRSERSERSPQRRDSNQSDKGETYVEYNSSLDKMNQSLTDLQSEIMRLSLKQKRPAEPTQESGSHDDIQRSRSRSPPHVLDVRQKALPDKPVVKTSEGSRRSQISQHSQGRSSSEPRLVPEDPPVEVIGNYNSQTLPRQPSYQQQQQQNIPSLQPQPYMMPNQNQVTMAGPAGPVYANPNQYVPLPGQAGIPPTAQQYGSYIMGPGAPPHMGAIPHPQHMPGYQQSPTHIPVYPSAQTGMYPGHPGQPYPTQPIMSPSAQPYTTMYPSPPHTQFQPQPTYSTSALQHQIPFTSPTSQPLMYDPSNQYNMYQQSQLQQTSHKQEVAGAQVAKTGSQNVLTMSAALNEIQTGSREPYTNNQTGASHIPRTENSDSENINKSVPVSSESHSINNDSGIETHLNDTGGFFISMNEGSPRRQKPQLSDKKVKPELEVSQPENKCDSSVIDNFAQNVAEQQHPGPEREEPTPEASGVPAAPAVTDPVGDEGTEADTSALKYVIGQDESMLDQSAEEEMAKKKEKIEKMRQKRHEEQERKRLKQELEMNRKRESERAKQDESERRKLEEKARRELIFKQYLEKKDEDDNDKVVKKDKPKQKPRPKSMYVKVGAGSDLGDGLDSNGISTEDLSASNPRSGMAARGNNSTANNALSCNTLTHNGMSLSQDSKSLAYGGLTHRRPPSPDLYGNRPRRPPRSNDGSETGSDYSGPKLFVKPSSKSNRHIIINALSHCCLAGSVNTDTKNKVLEEVAKSSAKHFMVLFRDTSCSYRGLYGYDPDSEDCVKITGVGPRQIQNDMIEKYYKYNSGGKSFSEVKSTKHLSVSIDAISLQNSVWKPNKAPAKGFR